jgi:phage tail protein X
MAVYRTTQADTWDQVALKAYGSEMATAGIMAENGMLDPLLLTIWRFDNGTELRQPELRPDAKTTSQLPVWRRDDA